MSKEYDPIPAIVELMASDKSNDWTDEIRSLKCYRAEHEGGYNGWTNRETWAVALHINNDQGWQESVLDALREATYEPPMFPDITDAAAHKARQAGEIIRENVEDRFADVAFNESWGEVLAVLTDIGSLWRVNWAELGASFLDDIRDETDRDQWSFTDDSEGDEPAHYGE